MYPRLALECKDGQMMSKMDTNEILKTISKDLSEDLVDGENRSDDIASSSVYLAEGQKKKDGYPISLPLETYSSKNFVSKPCFGVFFNIVKYMQTRYQNGNYLPLTLEEILVETKQENIEDSFKKWLACEALLNNPKIEVTLDNKFCFKPTYKLTDGISLMRLLKHNHKKGLGGVLLSEVEEILPDINKILKAYANKLTIITRPLDKKKILFFKDTTDDNMTIDEDIKKLWQSVNVSHMEDVKITKYLKEKGIGYLEDSCKKKTFQIKENPPSKEVGARD